MTKIVEWTPDLSLALRDLLLQENDSLEGGKFTNSRYELIASKLNAMFNTNRVNATSIKYKRTLWSGSFRKIHEIGRMSGVRFDQETYALHIDKPERYQAIKDSEKRKTTYKYFCTLKLNSTYGNSFYKSLEPLFWGTSIKETPSQARNGSLPPIDTAAVYHQENSHSTVDLSPQLFSENVSLSNEIDVSRVEEKSGLTMDCEVNQNSSGYGLSFPNLKNQLNININQIKRKHQEVKDQSKESIQKVQSKVMMPYQILESHVKKQKIEEVIQRINSNPNINDSSINQELRLIQTILDDSDKFKALVNLKDMNIRVQTLFKKGLITKDEIGYYISMTVINPKIDESIYTHLKSKIDYDDDLFAIAFIEAIKCFPHPEND